MKPLERVHEAYVLGRRAHALGRRIAALLPLQARVLDVGCGDGVVAWLVMQARPDVTVTGVEVNPRPSARIPVQSFDGQHLPFPERSFVVVMLVDVVHHAEVPNALLAEAARVASDLVIVKDHLRAGFLARTTLRFMDRVGNLRHGVPVLGVYWDRLRWLTELSAAGLEVRAWYVRLGLYPWPASLLFERRLHFLALLAPHRPSLGGLSSV